VEVLRQAVVDFLRQAVEEVPVGVPLRAVEAQGAVQEIRDVSFFQHTDDTDDTDKHGYNKQIKSAFICVISVICVLKK